MGNEKAAGSSARDGGERRETRFALLVASAFLLAVTLGLIRHEMWRDELQAWMIARDASSFPNLFHNLRYEGHPVLWYLGLFLISRVTRDPLAMQLYHGFLSTTAVFLFARFAPLPRWMRLIFAIGYFPLFEYGLVSRSYVLGALCIFALCTVHVRRPTSYLTKGLLLALLANTSAYGLVLAAAYLAATGVDLLLRYRAAGKGLAFLPASEAKRIVIGAIVAVCGLAFAFLSSRPPADAVFEITRHESGLPFKGAVITLLQAQANVFCPVPDITKAPDVWNTFTAQKVLGLIPQGYNLAGLVLIGALLFLLRRKPFALAFYAVGICGFIALFDKHYPEMRHLGNLFLLTTACCWLALSESATTNNEAAEQQTSPRPAPLLAFLGTMLTLNALAGLYMYTLDVRYPFSQGKQAVALLRAQHLEQLPLLGDTDHLLSTIGGYLDHPMYYVDSDREGTFVIWDSQRKHFGNEERLAKIAAYVTQHQGDCVVAMCQPIPASSVPSTITLTEVGHFTGSIVGLEKYYLYVAKPKP
jgi:hypothetical protein